MKRVRGFNRRTDVNHVAIKLAFSHLGCSVADARLMGQGFPDLVIGYRGQNLLVEVKKPRGPRAKADDRKDTQKDFAATWKGQAPAIVRTIDDVQKLVSEIQ